MAKVWEVDTMHQEAMDAPGVMQVCPGNSYRKSLQDWPQADPPQPYRVVAPVVSKAILVSEAE